MAPEGEDRRVPGALRSVRALIADDHELMREGLRSILEGQKFFQVAGEARSGREAVRLTREIRPDVVIMDVVMKDMNGIEATRAIRELDPGVVIVALSNHADRRYVNAMLGAGASAYVLKSEAFSVLRHAVEEALAGRICVCTGSEGEEEPAPAPRTELGPDASRLERLGTREQQVLKLVAQGYSSSDIAKRLFIAVSTVETHRRNIVRKLGIHRVADLTRYAVRVGLVDLD